MECESRLSRYGQTFRARGSCFERHGDENWTNSLFLQCSVGLGKYFWQWPLGSSETCFKWFSSRERTNNSFFHGVRHASVFEVKGGRETFRLRQICSSQETIRCREERVPSVSSRMSRTGLFLFLEILPENRWGFHIIESIPHTCDSVFPTLRRVWVISKSMEIVRENPTISVSGVRDLIKTNTVLMLT